MDSGQSTNEGVFLPRKSKIERLTGKELTNKIREASFQHTIKRAERLMCIRLVSKTVAPVGVALEWYTYISSAPIMLLSEPIRSVLN